MYELVDAIIVYPQVRPEASFWKRVYPTWCTSLQAVWLQLEWIRSTTVAIIVNLIESTRINTTKLLYAHLLKFNNSDLRVSPEHCSSQTMTTSSKCNIDTPTLAHYW